MFLVLFVGLLACLLLYGVSCITMCIVDVYVMWLRCLYLLYRGWLGENYWLMVVCLFLFVEHE